MAQIEALDGAAGSAKSGTTVLASSNATIQILMAGSLSLLWGLVNSLQIVAYFPLLVVSYPDNAKISSGTLLDLARFDMIPLDLLVKPVEELFGVERDEG